MSTYSSDEEIQDDDPTDELPILTDIMLGEAAERATSMPGPAVEAEDTGKFRPASDEAQESAAARLRKDLDSRNERLSTLEDELMRLQQRWSETEAALLERDTELSHVRAELADREAAISEQRTVLEQTTEALHEHETTIAEQAAALDSQRTRAEALEQQIRELQRKLDEIEAEHATAHEQPIATLDDTTVTRLRSDIAALSQHIENRNAIWHEQAATLAAQSTRIRELEIEVAQRLERQLTAEQYAETEAVSARSARERLGQALTALQREKSTAEYGHAVKEVKPAPTEDEDHAARLRRELARTVLLQAEQGDDPGTLRRLAELEAAIVGLEVQMDGPDAEPVPVPMPVPAKLVCLTGDELAEFTLDKETVTIGRGATCDIKIRTHYVSREHARITITDTGYFIEDLSSRNGVFVNAVKIERETLQANDLITIGDAQFRYQSGENE